MSRDLLLDAHAVIWLTEDDSRIRSVLPALDDPASTVTISAVTWFEIAVKHAIGKLACTVGATVGQLSALGLLDLPITAAHAEQLERLPLHHRDPFDRMLIAQAMVEGLTVATRDPHFSDYGVPILW